MPVPLLVVSTALFLSGAAGLVYQVVWLRMLGLVFGHAVDALTAVLVAFMSGLALGSALGGRLSSRARAPLAIYAWLEAGIAVYALCLPPGLPGLTRVSLTLRDALGLSYEGWSLVQVALAFLVLLPPTVLMGATLPLVSQALASGGEAPGRRVGALYAVNTWGAVTGTLAAGYFLLPPLGNRVTVWIAAGANLTAAALALTVARRGALAPPSVLSARGEEASSRVAWLIPAAMAVSGAVAMVFEIAWTRALSLLLGSSTYAFTAMLLAVLIGLAMGSAVYAWRWGTRPVGPATLGVIQGGVGLSAAVVLVSFDRLPDLILAALRVSTVPSWVDLVEILVSVTALTMVTLWMGAAFPCAIAAWAPAGARVGRGVGRLYAANTAGAIVGVLLGGLVLVPTWGIHGSLKMAVAATLMLCGALLVAGPGSIMRRSLPAAAALALALSVTFLPDWDRRLMSSAPAVYAPSYLRAGAGRPLREIVRDQEILFYRDGRSGTVAVTRERGQVFLRINGKIDAGTVVDMPTQIMVGLLPLLFYNAATPPKVALVGFGSGVTDIGI